MTDRYFYTDPLAAAWMARYFGMRFKGTQNEYWKDVDLDYLGECAFAFGPVEKDGEGAHRSGFLGDKFYIHHDSVKLLEIGIGDIVKTGNEGPLEVISDELYKKLTDDVINVGYINLSFIKKWNSAIFPNKIIQRNGTAFMWPEKEEG